jgi:hypothetical protein
MSEWLTTGEMIDRLKVGEVAESKSMSWRGVIVNSKRVIKDNGVIRFEDSDEILSLNAQIMDSQWRILPKYVSFEKAYEAGKQGKVVNFHYKDGMIHRIEHFDDSLDENGLSCYCLRELIEGDWSIED